MSQQTPIELRILQILEEADELEREGQRHLATNCIVAAKIVDVWFALMRPLGAC